MNAYLALGCNFSYIFCKLEAIFVADFCGLEVFGSTQANFRAQGDGLSMSGGSTPKPVSDERDEGKLLC
jgi:hypothetical protein